MNSSLIRFHFLRAAALGLAMVVWAGAAPAQRVDTKASEVKFVTRMMGVPVEGRFERWDAQVAFDPRQPATARVALRIDTTSATFASAEVGVEAQRAAWFDSPRFRDARFESTAVKALDGGRYELSGRLTLKGRTRDIAVPIVLERSGDAGTASGGLAVRRLDFGIGEGEWSDTSLVAAEVQVRFRIALTGLAP